MSKWDKLIEQIKNLDKDLRFDQLKKIIESYGYAMEQPHGGSSHCTFRKPGHVPITIPKHSKIKTVYLKMVKELIEKEEDNSEKD